MVQLTTREFRVLSSALHCLRFNLDEHNQDNIDDISIVEIQRLQNKLLSKAKDADTCLDSSKAEKPN